MMRFDGAALLERRAVLGLSVRELAREIGVSPATLSLWERGIVQPNRRNMARLAALLWPERTNGRRRDALGT